MPVHGEKQAAGADEADRVPMMGDADGYSHVRYRGPAAPVVSPSRAPPPGRDPDHEPAECPLTTPRACLSAPANTHEPAEPHTHDHTGLLGAPHDQHSRQALLRTATP